MRAAADLASATARRGAASAPRNLAWLGRWDATAPSRSQAQPRSFASMVRSMRDEARAGRQLPFVVEYDGRFVGQLTVSNIVRGSAQFASIGYWIDEAYAGRGIITRAVAMAIDHCFGAVGLHRIEVAIRPENTVVAAGRREARHQGDRLRPALPAHRRRLARPPAVRDHPRGGAAGTAVTGSPRADSHQSQE